MKFNAHLCRKVAIIGNHVPRQCGLAHFTADLAEALTAVGLEAHVIAMNDRPEHYSYPKIVRFEIEQDDPESYKATAQLINFSGYDLVCLQHEFGIFGGNAGSHILLLLRSLTMPLVTTLHTVLADPNPDQRATLEEIIQLSERVIVMSQKGKDLLEECYGTESSKIEVIPHGIPVPIEESQGHAKHALGFEIRELLFTFGLISESKGIEMMIEAMATIAKAHPNVLYLVAGKTHPNVRLAHGEQYRERLQERVRELGLNRNVRFLDRYMDMKELGRYLRAADIYITPYKKREQITSGTLAYAYAWGNAVVSTPYWHAEELLAEDRGLLVPFDDSTAMANAVIELLDDRDRLRAIQSNAKKDGERMVWPYVGELYSSLFSRVLSDSVNVLKHVRSIQPELPMSRTEIPPVDFQHVRRMTDDTGILQHAIHDVPLRAEGYCTDDNARALLLAVRAAGNPTHSTLNDLSHRYLGFLHHAFNAETGRFRNFAGYDRRWLDDGGSEDSHARAVWALGAASRQAPTSGERALSTQLFFSALPAVEGFSSPRAWAFVLLGLREHLSEFEGDGLARQMQESLSHKLMFSYRRYSKPGWQWFEDVLAYDNARLAEALLSSGTMLGNPASRDVALEALEWLVEQQTGSDGNFLPIGSNGFYRRTGLRAFFDQQPVEAWAMIDACWAAYEATGLRKWCDEATQIFKWFLGANTLRQPLYSTDTGGCFDGLHPDRVNQNQGAESTLSYQLARQRIDSILAISQAKASIFTKGRVQ